MITAGIDIDVIVVTIDLDWAPDYAIDLVADALAERGVRATWLVTHDSDAVARLRDRADLFELGIHPNFSGQSTHGRRMEEVLDHCMRLVPDATSMRTHHLYQLTPLFDTVLERTPIRSDLSLYLHRARHLAPVPFYSGGRVLHRLPTFWQDDQGMNDPHACWDPAELTAVPGLKVMNFHPLHVYLNSGAFEHYGSVRDSIPHLSQLPEPVARGHIRTGPGTGTLFRALLARLEGTDTLRARDLVERLDAVAATRTVPSGGADDG